MLPKPTGWSCNRTNWEALNRQIYRPKTIKPMQRGLGESPLWVRQQETISLIRVRLRGLSEFVGPPFHSVSCIKSNLNGCGRVELQVRGWIHEHRLSASDPPRRILRCNDCRLISMHYCDSSGWAAANEWLSRDHVESLAHAIRYSQSELNRKREYYRLFVARLVLIRSYCFHQCRFIDLQCLVLKLFFGFWMFCWKSNQMVCVSY